MRDSRDGQASNVVRLKSVTDRSWPYRPRARSTHGSASTIFLSGHFVDRQIGGASHVTIAANEGIKMDIARKLGVADAYIPLSRDRTKASEQWAKLKEDNPCGSSKLAADLRSDGFDVVAECTGAESIVNDSINYVSRGGTLLVYGVYADSARVEWSPTKIFVDEIKCGPQLVR